MFGEHCVCLFHQQVLFSQGKDAARRIHQLLQSIVFCPNFALGIGRNTTGSFTPMYPHSERQTEAEWMVSILYDTLSHNHLPASLSSPISDALNLELIPGAR